MAGRGRSFSERITFFWDTFMVGIRELSDLSHRNVLVIYRKSGHGAYRVNPGIAMLVLAVFDLVAPAVVVLGLFFSFVLGVRARVQRLY